MIFPDEIWEIILDYILWQIPKNATIILKKHATLSYVFSLHKYKGLQNNLDYHKDRNPWIFNIMSIDEIKNIIQEAEQNVRD